MWMTSYSIHTMTKPCHHIYHRIADTVEEIHSESARRLQLQSGEESKNETFPANTLVFTELKVLTIVYVTFTELLICFAGNKRLPKTEWY